MNRDALIEALLGFYSDLFDHDPQARALVKLRLLSLSDESLYLEFQREC